MVITVRSTESINPGPVLGDVFPMNVTINLLSIEFEEQERLPLKSTISSKS